MIGLAAVALGAAFFGYRFVSDYEVLEKGQILPYTLGLIYKVQFGGRLTLYLEPELRPTMDLLNAYILTGIAFISLTFGVILATVTSRMKGLKFWFFATTFMGMSYLVVDEIFGVHESIGHNLQFLAKLPLITRPDDAVILFMAVPAALFLFVFRKVILASFKAKVLFGAGFICFALSAISDILTLSIEEPLEILASLFLAAAITALGLHHAIPGYDPPGRGPRPGTR